MPKRVRLEAFAAAFALVPLLLAGEFYVFDRLAQYVAAGGTLGSPATRFDRMIPLVPEFVWPYWVYFLFLFSMAWLPRTRREIVQLIGSFMALNIISWITFILYPTAMVRPEILCKTLSCGFVGAVYLVDPGTAVMPSLHVGNSVLVAGYYFHFRSPLRWFAALFTLSITLATVFVRQHYLLDIPAGIAYAAVSGLLGWRAFGWLWDRILTLWVDELPENA